MEETFVSKQELIEKELVIIPGFEQVAVVALVSPYCFTISQFNNDRGKRILKSIKKFYENYSMNNFPNANDDYSSTLRSAMLDEMYGDNSDVVLLSEVPGVDLSVLDDSPIEYSSIHNMLSRILTDKKFALAMMQFMIKLLDSEEKFDDETWKHEMETF